MKARVVAAVVAVKSVLLSKELRPSEMLILRAVVAAAAVKLGVDVSGLG